MVIAGPFARLGILGLAGSSGLALSLCAIDTHPLIPACRLEQILLSIIEPTIDEVAVQAVPITNLKQAQSVSQYQAIKIQTHLPTSQLQRRHAIPAPWNQLPHIIPDTKPQLRNPLHPRRTPSPIGRHVSILFNIFWIHTIREPQNRLNIPAARNPRHRRPWSVLPILRSILTPPRNTRRPLIHVGLTLRTSVSRDDEEVLGVGDLGFVDVFVVGAEHAGVDFDMVGSVDVEKGWRPVHGQVVGVLA